MTSSPPQARFLMCRPAHFAVTYAINPWMDPENWARNDHALGAAAWQEWAALHQTLCELGAAIVKGIFPGGAVRATSLGTPALSLTITGLQGILIEAALTFFLVTAVFGTAVSPEAPKVGGFGIGLAIFVAALVGGPFTGAALNPARA